MLFLASVSPGGYVTRPSQNSPLDGSLAGPSGTFTSTRVTPPLNLSLGVEPVFHHPVTDRKAKAIQKRRTQRFAGQKLRTKVKVREKIVKADDNQSTEDQTTPVLVCMTKKRQKTDNISTERQKRGITHVSQWILCYENIFINAN